MHNSQKTLPKLTLEQAIEKVRKWAIEEEQAERQFTFEVRISGDGRGGYEVKQRQWRR